MSHQPAQWSSNAQAAPDLTEAIAEKLYESIQAILTDVGRTDLRKDLATARSSQEVLERFQVWLATLQYLKTPDLKARRAAARAAYERRDKGETVDQLFARIGR